MFGKETFRCIVTTEEESVLAVDATSAVVPTTEGLLGILVDRAPFLAAVGSGKLVIRQHEQSRLFTVSGGVAHMRENVLTVLAATCKPA
jgi:F0F1-type ATP synthase epsilon subunit